MTAPTPPLFVSLDGIDGCGKSTQCRLLVDWLRAQGHRVTACRDPGGTPLGDAIRQLVLEHPGEMSLWSEAYLFMASRAELVRLVIEPALGSGDIVVSDRFVLANVVYQGHAGGLNPDDLWQMATLSTHGRLPDLCVVLDLPVHQAMARRGRQTDRMERKGSAFQERVRQGFLTEAARQPQRIRVVDASGSVQAVHEAICQLLSIERPDVNHLWRQAHSPPDGSCH